jgi:CRP-like cAMP-binding protein
MKTTDARRLNQETQYELRKQVVRFKKKGELDNQAISEIVGLCPAHISTIWKKYQRGGLKAAIKPKVRGRRLREKFGSTPPRAGST